MEPDVKGKWGSAGANAGRRTWRSGGQIEHERRSWRLTGVALELITAPVYVAAATAQLAGRPLTYVVTAKGSAATGDSVRTFRAHLGWAGLAAGSVLAGVALSHSYPSLYLLGRRHAAGHADTGRAAAFRQAEQACSPPRPGAAATLPGRGPSPDRAGAHPSGVSAWTSCRLQRRASRGWADSTLRVPGW